MTRREFDILVKEIKDKEVGTIVNGANNTCVINKIESNTAYLTSSTGKEYTLTTTKLFKNAFDNRYTSFKPNKEVKLPETGDLIKLVKSKQTYKVTYSDNEGFTLVNQDKSDTKSFKLTKSTMLLGFSIGEMKLIPNEIPINLNNGTYIVPKSEFNLVIEGDNNLIVVEPSQQNFELCLV